MPPVAIVLVDFNGLDDTHRCLDSLSRLNSAADVIVVDNASSVNVAASLMPEFPKVHYLRSTVNGGWAGGNNLGLKAALDRGAELIILLNNDTTVEPQFVERLVDAAERHPGHGILGPVIRFLEPPYEVQTEGVTFNKPNQPGFFQRVPVPLDGRVMDVDIVNGCCLMVRRSVVEQIGFIDEEFFLIHEESDFCLRAQEAGFKLGVLGEALVFHKGSSTFAREGKKLQRYYDSRNLLRLLRKHRNRPGERSRWASFMHAIRYSFSRYALEREKDYYDSANAVLEGLYDGLLRRGGVKRDGWRPGFRVFRMMVALMWRLKR